MLLLIALLATTSYSSVLLNHVEGHYFSSLVNHIKGLWPPITTEESWADILMYAGKKTVHWMYTQTCICTKHTLLYMKNIFQSDNFLIQSVS